VHVRVYMCTCMYVWCARVYACVYMRACV